MTLTSLLLGLAPVDTELDSLFKISVSSQLFFEKSEA